MVWVWFYDECLTCADMFVHLIITCVFWYHVSAVSRFMKIKHVPIGASSSHMDGGLRMQFPQSTVAICWSLFFSVSNNAYVSGVSTNVNLIYLYIHLIYITSYYWTCWRFSHILHIVVPSVATLYLQEVPWNRLNAWLDLKNCAMPTYHLVLPSGRSEDVSMLQRTIGVNPVPTYTRFFDPLCKIQKIRSRPWDHGFLFFSN